MNKKTVFCLITIIMLFVSSCSWKLDTRRLLLGCYWQKCVPERNFYVLDWKIPTILFPSDIKAGDMMISSEGIGEMERGSQNAFWNGGNGIAIYTIYRFATVKKAIKQYENTAKQMVDDGTKNAWVRPKKLTFSSSTADETFVGCGDWMERRCGVLARYQEYVIFFNAAIDEKMTYEKFEEIAIYLDEQISSRLYP